MVDLLQKEASLMRGESNPNHGYKNQGLEYSEELDWFRKVAVVDSSLGLMISPAMGTWLGLQNRDEFRQVQLDRLLVTSEMRCHHHCTGVDTLPVQSLLWFIDFTPGQDY